LKRPAEEGAGRMPEVSGKTVEVSNTKESGPQSGCESDAPPMPNGILKAITFLLATDLDGRIPFNKSKDGYSVFNALATFALAQGAALTAVASSEGREPLVLSIYAGIVLVTIAWISSMLRMLGDDVDEAGNTVPVRAYDRPSIRYGRWTLTWSFFLGAIMLILGSMELLPNQTRRVKYDEGPIECEALTYLQRMDRSGQTRQMMDKWIEWLGKSSRVYKEEQFFWVQQKSPLADSYKPFALDLKCDQNYLFGERAAFILSESPDEYRPQYRQLRFRGQNLKATNSAILDVKDAKEGDSIVVLLYARDPNTEEVDKQPSGQQFNFRLIPHFGNE